MSNKEYVTYEQAKVLKELGFDTECDYHFSKEDAPGGLVWGIKSFAPANHNANGYLSIPTLAQAAKWLREEKNLHIQVMLNGVRTMYFVRVYVIEGNAPVYEVEGQFDDYESALSAGISKCLEIINEKRNRL